jgi:hypothetical protein
VPAAQRPRTHRKARPALGRQQTARSRQQRPVESPVLRSLPAPPEDRELVSQHHDLELPLTTTPDEHPDHPAQKPVQQTHGHNAQSEPARPRSPTPPTDRNRVSLPHKSSSVPSQPVFRPRPAVEKPGSGRNKAPDTPQPGTGSELVPLFIGYIAANLWAVTRQNRSEIRNFERLPGCRGGVNDPEVR